MLFDVTKFKYTYIPKYLKGLQPHCNRREGKKKYKTCYEYFP